MARSFNGTSDLITYTAATCSGVANSVSIWFYQTATQTNNGYYTIHDKWDGTNHFLGIFGSGSSAAKMAYYSDSGAGAKDPGLSTYSNNIWNHVALVLSGSGSTMQAYLNGVADGTGSWTSNSTAASKLGFNSQNAHWGGYLADFALWSGYALTTTDVSNLFNGVRPISIQSGSLQIYSPLDGYASPETDLSGNGNNGTLTGTTRIIGPPALWRISA